MGWDLLPLPERPLACGSIFMNAVEIEEAISRLAEQPFDAETFPSAFLEAFGNKPTGTSAFPEPRGTLAFLSGIPAAICHTGTVRVCGNRLHSVWQTAFRSPN